jgi:hypothetical protein
LPAHTYQFSDNSPHRMDGDQELTRGKRTISFFAGPPNRH